MQNSKRFPIEDWQEDSFLSPSQLKACRDLFLANESQLALSILNLTRLSAEIKDSFPASTYLTPDEQDRLASFTFAKRQSEWLGGRIAAKKAAIALVPNQPCPTIHYQDFSVESHSSGRPFLLCQTEVSKVLPEISISHSAAYAGALAVTGQGCGLDLQRITNRVTRVCDRFASNAELLLLANFRSLTEASALTLLWSAKEAFRKAIDCQPLTGFTEITLNHLEGNPQHSMIGYFSCPRLTPTLLPAFMLIRHDYACAITVIDSPA